MSRFGAVPDSASLTRVTESHRGKGQSCTAVMADDRPLPEHRPARRETRPVGPGVGRPRDGSLGDL
jgi:hypothetical protein